jgi:uncharacterized membrane protein YGL010W
MMKKQMKVIMMTMMKRNILLRHVALVAGAAAVRLHLVELLVLAVGVLLLHLDLMTTMKMNTMIFNLVHLVEDRLVDHHREEDLLHAVVDKSYHTTEVVAEDLLNLPHSLVVFLPSVTVCPMPTL